jgi:hypothetical protein
VQRVLLASLVQGRPRLIADWDSLQPFRFVHESFSSSKRLFDMVDQHAPQRPLPEAEAAHLRADPLV